MVTRVDEAFQQQGLEAPVIEPVRACAARELSQDMAGQMRYPDVGKDQEAAVVHHPRHVLAAGLRRPADPAVAHGYRAGSAGQQDAAQAPVARRDEVAQPVTERPLETQRVPARHQRIPLRHPGRLAYDLQAHRAERRQRTVNRCFVNRLHRWREGGRTDGPRRPQGRQYQQPGRLQTFQELLASVDLRCSR